MRSEPMRFITLVLRTVGPDTIETMLSTYLVHKCVKIGISATLLRKSHKER